MCQAEKGSELIAPAAPEVAVEQGSAQFPDFAVGESFPFRKSEGARSHPAEIPCLPEK